MDYKDQHDKEVNELKKKGFEHAAILWHSAKSPGVYALSMSPEVNGNMPDSGVIITALITILDTLEEEFNSTGFVVGSQTYTFPANTNPN